MNFPAGYKAHSLWAYKVLCFSFYLELQVSIVESAAIYQFLYCFIKEPMGIVIESSLYVFYVCLKVHLVKNACWLWLICICVYIAYFFTIAGSFLT